MLSAGTLIAEQLPLRIFMQIVDLPLSDLPKLKYLADQFTRPDGSLTYPEVGQLFRDYIEPIIGARRGADGEDMLSRMINGEVDGRPLTDEEAANLCIQVLVGGLDTVANFLSFVMWFLARDPKNRQTLKADPSNTHFTNVRSNISNLDLDINSRSRYDKFYI